MQQEQRRENENIFENRQCFKLLALLKNMINGDNVNKS